MKIIILADLPSIHTQVWTKYLYERGHEIIPISFRPDDEYSNKYILMQSRISGKMKYLTKAGEIKRIVRREKPDLLMGFFVSSYGFLVHGFNYSVSVYSLALNRFYKSINGYSFSQ